MWTIQSEALSQDGPIRYFWIPNLNDAYVIGDDGTLWTRYKGKGRGCFLSDGWERRYPAPTAHGYLVVTLSLNGVSFNTTIHKLVCEAVHGPCPPGQEACHNDGDTSNNNWWNLRFDTKKNNEIDKIAHGTDGRGERHSQALLNWNKIREIREKYNTGKYTQKDLGLEYGVTESCIGRIVRNEIWIENQVLAGSP